MRIPVHHSYHIKKFRARSQVTALVLRLPDELGHPLPTEHQRDQSKQHPPQFNSELETEPAPPGTLTLAVGARLGAQDKAPESGARLALHVFSTAAHQQSK